VVFASDLGRVRTRYRVLHNPTDGDNRMTSDDLAIPFAGLADIINREHELAQRAAATAIEHALRAGEHLERVKRELPHGAWAGWLAEHFTGSERTAQRYMRLHRHRGVLEASNPSRVTDMTIRAALAEVASPKAEHPEHAAEDAFAERTTAYLDRLTASGELYDLDLLDLGGSFCTPQTNIGDWYISGCIIRDPTTEAERYLVCRFAIGAGERGEVTGTGRGVGVLGVPLVLDRLGLPPLSDDAWAYHSDDTWAKGVHADLMRHARRAPPRWRDVTAPPTNATG
jgi:hypothetical protein